MSYPYDRAASEPGGMECMECGIIFVGGSAHDQCAVCANNGWMPIDTAPKDGTHVLAFCALPGIRCTNLTNPPTVTHWFDDPDEPGFYTSVNEMAPQNPFRPTHWRPLPAPPVSP